MHVVVTGAGGFVGGRVALHLAAQRHRVTAITRALPPATKANLEWRQADLSNADALPDHFDSLVYCAAANPAHVRDPIKLYENNIAPCRKAFAAAKTSGARSIVFLSSMSVYGTVNVPVVTEGLRPHDPDPYGRAKADAEDVLEGHVAQGLHAALSIRLPGTVGKGSHHNFLSGVLERIAKGERVEAKNPGALFNNIVFVGDLAEYVAYFIQNPKPGYSVTNMAAENAIPLRQVISLMYAAAGKPENVLYSDGGKRPFLISNERAKMLGYRPATVEQSVRSFVEDSLGVP